MRQLLSFSLLLGLFSCSTALHSLQSATEDRIRTALDAHAVPLKGGGEALLLREARNHDFFLLGELHGETEIPALLQELWPSLWEAGYRHAGAEVSPWAAELLERSSNDNIAPPSGLWTRDQARTVHQFAVSGHNVLWGCDIEEAQPERLILTAAKLNPEGAKLQQMTKIISGGYMRAQAPALSSLAEADSPAHDVSVGGFSLWRNLVDTLRVESLRSDPATKLAASESRELVMKKLFLAHYQQQDPGKVFMRFGRNHLHRGYDARGVSTLGNFIAELALATNKSVFNVGVFAAGGKEHLAGETFDADERQDELTFKLLADLAGTKATLFDLRPLKPMLHSIPSEKRTPLEANLVYWADSYDFLLCYPTVTPLLDDPGKASSK